MLNNLEQLFARMRLDFVPEPEPTGSREEIGREYIRRCREKEQRLSDRALEMEREGDEDGCWMAMHVRASCQRFREQVERDLGEELAPVGGA